MKLRLFKLDSFAEKVFSGNPACVVPLDGAEWLSEDVMQQVASENNATATAFYKSAGEGCYDIRWFTPCKEVKLCGHATLATGYVLFNIMGVKEDVLRLNSLSGPLTVVRAGDKFTLDFPGKISESLASYPQELQEAFGISIKEVMADDDFLVVCESEEELKSMTPDMNLLMQLPRRGVAVSAPSQEEGIDFSLRFFAPKYGIPEDSVTGSAFARAAPYWAAKMGKATLEGKQHSKRSGLVTCTVDGERVLLTGNAVLYMTAEIEI